MKPPRDLSHDLYKLGRRGGLPAGTPPQFVHHPLRADERRLAADPLMMLAWTFIAGALAAQLILLGLLAAA
jgi:hypothetical protein